MNKFSNYLLLIIISFLFLTCESNTQENTNTAAAKDFDVVIRLSAEPDGLNPFIGYSGYATQVKNHIFQSLLDFDPQTLQLVPALAKAAPTIEIIEEGPDAGNVNYTFEILEQATWENGTPVTAADYIFTFKTIFNPAIKALAGYRYYFPFLKSINVDPNNPRKFTIQTDSKYILAETVLGNIEVIPAYLFDPTGSLENIELADLLDPENAKELLASNPAIQTFADAYVSSKYSTELAGISGSGPYRLAEWKKGEELILEKKKDWWGNSIMNERQLLKAIPQRLIYRAIADETVALTLFKSGEIDAIGDLSPNKFIELKENQTSNNFYDLYSPTSLEYSYLSINTKSAKLEDKRVRRALAHLIDLDNINETVFYGLANRLVGPFLPSTNYYHDGLQPISYQVEKARTLLNEAGWKDTNGNGIVDKMINGELVELQLSIKLGNGTKEGKAMAELFKNTARKGGVDIVPTVIEFNKLGQDYRAKNFELVLIATTGYPVLDDPNRSWHTKFDTPKGSNRTGFGNAKSDAILEKIIVTLDETERNKLYRDFQEIIYEEQPCIFIFTMKERIAVNNKYKIKPSALRPGFFENSFVLK